MGGVISRLGLRRGGEPFQFLKPRNNPLTVVSEGEEVVWTNFDLADKETFRYDLPKSMGSDSTIVTNGGGSTSRRPSAVESQQSTKRSMEEQLLGTPPMNVSSPQTLRRPSSNAVGDKSKENRRGSALATGGELIEVPLDLAASPSPETARRKSTAKTGEPIGVVVASPTAAVGRSSQTEKQSATRHPSAPNTVLNNPEVPVGRTSQTEKHFQPELEVRRQSALKSSNDPVAASTEIAKKPVRTEEPFRVEPVLRETANDEISIISLNLLADCNLTNSVNNPDDGRYKHAVECAPWTVRLPALRAIFEKHSSTDVFALQEVDFTRFNEDLKPMMAEFGYEGLHQWDEEFAKKGAPNHPFGVATFYKKSKFREAFKEARSRSFIVGLARVDKSAVTSSSLTNEKEEPSGGKNSKKKGGKHGKHQAIECDWFIVNVHLEANSTKNEKRLAQLSSTLFNLSTHAKINPLSARVIVLGDFNSRREDPPFQWLLANYKPGSSTEEKSSSEAPSQDHNEQQQTQAQEDEGSKTDDRVAHAFNFADAYSQADATTQNAPTYADPFANFRVDHLLFTSDTSSVQSALAIPALTDTTRQYGIFGKDYPSDHYPVGCVLRALELTLPPESEPTKQEDEDDPNYCPLTAGQMRVLLFLEEGAPKRANKNAKPSSGELAALKSHAERVNAFTSHLTTKQKAWVNKWRKKFKPASNPVEEKPNLTAKERVERSRSFTMKNNEVFDLTALFREASKGREDEQTVQVALDSPPKTEKTAPLTENKTTEDIQKPTPGLTKRRQTVHGKRTTFADM